MTAKLHHIHSEPTSSFTPEQRAAILGEARQHVAEAKAENPRRPSIEAPIDVLRQWRAQADEQTVAREEEDRRRAGVEQRRQQRQHRQANASEQWGDYIANQIKIAIANEREHAEALLTGIISELMRQQQAVEGEVKALREKCAVMETELSSWRAPR